MWNVGISTPSDLLHHQIHKIYQVLKIMCQWLAPSKGVTDESSDMQRQRAATEVCGVFMSKSKGLFKTFRKKVVEVYVPGKGILK